jgi:hypothetical protein
MPSRERIGVISAHLTGARSQSAGERKPKPSRYLDGNFAPVRTELTDEPLVVTGILPDGLRGSFFRTGSNPLYDPSTPYHWYNHALRSVPYRAVWGVICAPMTGRFDGDGMTHAVRFDGSGRVTYSNKWVRSRPSFRSRCRYVRMRRARYRRNARKRRAVDRMLLPPTGV